MREAAVRAVQQVTGTGILALRREKSASNRGFTNSPSAKEKFRRGPAVQFFLSIFSIFTDHHATTPDTTTDTTTYSKPGETIIPALAERGKPMCSVLVPQPVCPSLPLFLVELVWHARHPRVKPFTPLVRLVHKAILDLPDRSAVRAT